MIALTNLLAITSLLGQNVDTGNKTKNSTKDNSNKSILARGCDPAMSIAQLPKRYLRWSENPEYVSTTDDADFFEKLKSRKWSVIFFAPGACRLSAAKQPIPGGNLDTTGWSLDQYHAMVRKLQGDEIQIVGTMDERQTVGILKDAFEKSQRD